MRRNVLHFTVDVLLAACVLVLVATGLLIALVLPPGSRGGGFTVRGWNRHDFGDLHYWVALAMIALAALHVALNWTWVCGVVVKLVRRGSAVPSAWARNVAGVVGLLVVVGVLAAFLAAAAAARVRGEGDHIGPRRGPGHGVAAPVITAPTLPLQ